MSNIDTGLDIFSLVPYNMVIMNYEPCCSKAPLKGELLRKIAQRYPEMDTNTIEVCSHIQSVARLLSARMNMDLANFGLTEGKFYVLGYLFSEELLGHEAPSPSDISDNLGVTRGTITGLLDGLERDDYLERSHDSQDRRALTIQLTDKARQFMDDFMHTGSHSMDQALPINELEKQTLIEVLSRIEETLRRSHEA